MARKADIVIAGAGAVGSTSALVSARAGHRVTVIDPAPPGANASGVAAGMLAPAFEALFDGGSIDDFALLRGARDLWPAFADGVGLTLRRDGALAVGSQADVAAWASQAARLGLATRPLPPRTVSSQAPLAAPGLWALSTEEDWRLDPAAALAALRRGAEAFGARFARGRVRGFVAGAVELDDATRIDAVALVIATGAARGLEAVAPELVRLTPVKGHILRAPWRGRAGPMLRASGVYVCVDEAQALLGASMEAGADDDVVDPAVVADLVARGAAIAPSVAKLAWTAATGVRATTPDGWPLAGRVGVEGVILAVGARRNGWLLAPVIAQAVAAAIEGREADDLARRFDPTRFSRG